MDDKGSGHIQRKDDVLQSCRCKKSTRPRTFQGLWNKATASLQSLSPLPAVSCDTVLQAPEGERMNYRLLSGRNQVEIRPRPCETDCRIAARSSNKQHRRHTFAFLWLDVFQYKPGPNAKKPPLQSCRTSPSALLGVVIPAVTHSAIRGAIFREDLVW